MISRYLLLVLSRVLFLNTIYHFRYIEGTVSSSTSSILMYLPMSPISHQKVFQSLADALAKKHHNVTIVLPAFGRVNQSELQGSIEHDQSLFTGSVNQIFIEFDFNFMKQFRTEAPHIMTDGVSVMRIFKGIKLIRDNMRACHTAALLHPEIVDFLNNKQKPIDLVIVPALFNEVGYYLAYKFKAPLILLMTTNFPTVLTLPMGYFDNPTFVAPIGYTGSQHEIPGFFTRLSAFVLYNSYWILKQYLLISIHEEILKDLNLLDTNENVDLLHLEANASFGMYVTHYVFDAVRPVLPNTLDIGFIHCKPPRALPKDLTNWFGSSKEKVVYVSFGSVIRFEDVPKPIQTAFLCAFADKRYRYVLRTSSFEQSQSNLWKCSWCPQQDILGHQETSLFISHGGFMSVQEALYHSVPILFLPLFSDAMANARRAERQGYGLIWNVSLDQSPDEMCKHLVQSIDQMLAADSNFTKRASFISRLIRDDIQSPAQKAVFWSEYVMRNAGADYMKSPAQNVPFFYFFHVDILLFLLTISFVAFYAWFIAIRITVIFAFKKMKKYFSVLRKETISKHD